MPQALTMPYSDDWPAPVVAVNENGASDFVLVCEHASRHIPAEFSDLGLPSSELERHIAWDIGAAAVANSLSGILDAPLFLAGYSRLLIDLNRPLGAPSSIPQRSESTDIPGNRNLPFEEAQRRADLMFTPFHDRVAAHVAERERLGRRTVIVAIHSFTPVFFDKVRPWHAGILHDRSDAFANALISSLRSDPAIIAEANVPYVIERSEDYAVLVHGQDRGHEAVLVEIRQDLIASQAGAEDWARRLGEALNHSQETGAI